MPANTHMAGARDVSEAETVGSVRANCTASVASEQDATHRTAAPKLTKLWAEPMARRAPPVAVADERRLAVAGTALRTRAESIVSRSVSPRRQNDTKSGQPSVCAEFSH